MSTTFRAITRGEVMKSQTDFQCGIKITRVLPELWLALIILVVSNVLEFNSSNVEHKKSSYFQNLLLNIRLSLFVRTGTIELIITTNSPKEEVMSQD